MTTVQMRGKGTITFPAKLRSKYKLQEGEVFTIIDLGGGSFLLKPKVLEVDILSRRIAKSLKEEDFDMEEWLPILREERKKFFQEKYGGVQSSGK
jgi:bifunctional DNA-binding transcriptional regulator/antitoxin component of YhaV-PrlF toxin-antitoxin module